MGPGTTAALRLWASTPHQPFWASVSPLAQCFRGEAEGPKPREEVRRCGLRGDAGGRSGAAAPAMAGGGGCLGVPRRACEGEHRGRLKLRNPEGGAVRGATGEGRPEEG